MTTNTDMWYIKLVICEANLCLDNGDLNNYKKKQLQIIVMFQTSILYLNCSASVILIVGLHL